MKKLSLLLYALLLLLPQFSQAYYDPTTGTWISRDPLGEAGGVNLYAFCNNDPVNNIDPDGRKWVTDKHIVTYRYDTRYGIGFGTIPSWDEEAFTAENLLLSMLTGLEAGSTHWAAEQKEMLTQVIALGRENPGALLDALGINSPEGIARFIGGQLVGKITVPVQAGFTTYDILGRAHQNWTHPRFGPNFAVMSASAEIAPYAATTILTALITERVVATLKKGRGGGGDGEAPLLLGEGWVHVARSQGLPFQAKMTGKPIIPRDGKKYIEEYLLRNVKFDDFDRAANILIDYKDYGNVLHNGKLKYFMDQSKIRNNFLDEAKRQIKAAQGIRLEWRVPRDQLPFFRSMLGDSVPEIVLIGL